MQRRCSETGVPEGSDVKVGFGASGSRAGLVKLTSSLVRLQDIREMKPRVKIHLKGIDRLVLVLM